MIKIVNPYIIPGLMRQTVKSVEVVDPTSSKILTRCLNAVCLYYGITREQIRSKSRQGILPDARAIFAFLIYERAILVDAITAKFICRDRSMIPTYRKNVQNALSINDARILIPLNNIRKIL